MIDASPCHNLSSMRANGAAFNASVWPRIRPEARCAVADVTEWFGETSGGIRTYLLEKGRYIADRPSLRHVLVVPGATDSVSESEGVTSYRLRGPRIPRQHPYRFMFAVRTLRNIIAHERPDLIEVGSPFLTPWLMRRVGREFRIPVVAFYHTSLPRLFGNARDGGTSWNRRWLHRGLSGYLGRLHGPLPLTIASSRFAIADLEQAGVPRIAHVPLGVDLERFRPRSDRDRMAERERRGLPTDAPLAAFVGRFASEKALHVVLDAWASVHARTGAVLALVGAGPMEAELRAHPAACGVRFLPFERDRTALAALLASLDIYVAPGPVETFGLAALEALASGTPVLSVDQGGVAELVGASGAGLCYPRGDAGGCGEQAVTLLQADRGRLGASARRYAEESHSWSRVFDRLFETYTKVIRDG
jgi:alpha-1,6-mannosyltransferase